MVKINSSAESINYGTVGEMFGVNPPGGVRCNLYPEPTQFGGPKGSVIMRQLCGKVLLLTAVFTVVLICILNTNHACAASKSSKKEKVINVKVNTLSKRHMIASRGNNYTIDNADINSVVSYAKLFIGIRYVYGSSGPNSFDCSGFTMYIIKMFGMNLPHSARSQAALGISISKNDLMQGDLVFFSTSGGKDISHVGMYIGGGNFIHASSGDGVKISSLNGGYYSREFVTARRIIST